MDNLEVYKKIVDNISDGVYFVDNSRRISFWNKAAEQITGYPAEELVGKHCAESCLNHIDAEGKPLCQIGCPLFATTIDGQQRVERVYVRHKNGYRLPLKVRIFPVRENGKIIGAVEIFSPDSPKVYKDDLVEKLSGIAMHDALTHLPNRRYLESFLHYKLTELRQFGQPFVVVFADIDDFSYFNNTYGHDAGDAVLVNIATSLKADLRSDDMFARWGGEEFVGVFPIDNDYEGSILAEKCRKLISTTDVPFEGKHLHVTVSLGVTKAREDDTIDSIIHRADMLMYKSKKAGKNQVSAD